MRTIFLDTGKIPGGNLCPDEEPECFKETLCCPGTYDRIQKKNVSCSNALVLREIALGRRIKRPDALDKYESLDYTLPVNDEAFKNARERIREELRTEGTFL